MDVVLGKFFLDALKELRDILAKAKDRKDNLIAVGTFLELYGCATRLEGHAQKVQLAHQDQNNTASLGESLRGFFNELRVFSLFLRNANLAAIEIYHPQLAGELERIVGIDASLAGTFASKLAPKYKLKTRHLKRLVHLYVDNYHVSGTPAWKAERDLLYELPLDRDSVQAWDTEAVWEQFEALAGYLTQFRRVIGEVIRETWDFKELATLRTSTH